MATKHFCDRCGKELNGSGISYTHTVDTSFFDLLRNKHYAKHGELCGKCGKELLKFLENVDYEISNVY